MIREMAWNTFKKTGDINTFIEFIKIRETEQNLGEIYGNNKN